MIVWKSDGDDEWTTTHGDYVATVRHLEGSWWAVINPVTDPDDWDDMARSGSPTLEEIKAWVEARLASRRHRVPPP